MSIEVIGAYAHNLKYVSAHFPLEKITVVHGLSGCGKSSLVLDVLHAESRRRYLETLGSRAITFLGCPKHVAVQEIRNLRPSIALECGERAISPKANVAGLAELSHLFRVLFAECGKQVCPVCGKEMAMFSKRRMVERIAAFAAGSKIQVMAPIKIGEKSLAELASVYLAQGFVRAVCDERPISLDSLSKGDEVVRPRSFRLIVDRIVASANQRTRISEAIDGALRIGESLVLVECNGESFFMSAVPRCEVHGVTADSLSAECFSPWSKRGWCKACNGVGLGCEVCGGLQLEERFLQTAWEGLSWRVLHSMPLTELAVVLPPLLAKVPERLMRALADIPLRVSMLCELGLGHLSLGRLAVTLSGGEAQRTKLAALCTGHLNGVLLCIDEPASGLHEKDVERLWGVLQKLKERGNSLALIEHHPFIISRADHVIELGEGAGELGGNVIYEGAYKAGCDEPALQACARAERSGFPCFLHVENACVNNLKNICVDFPVGALSVICGVSGSGKSSLLWGVVAPLVAGMLERREPPAGVEAILCARAGRVFAQKRSFVATAIGIMPVIRELFAKQQESKIRGYSASSFVTDKAGGGRCENCKGDGFLLDPSGYEECECPICLGKRFRDDVLEIRFKLLSIADVLDLTVLEAMKVFANFRNITERLEPLMQTGLHYLRLGQSTTHLSGGEAQRLKLSQDLAKARLPKTLYLFDEPARGLSMRDTDILLKLLLELTAKGHTVIAIEHNALFRRVADCVVELGPGAGQEGGFLLSGGRKDY